MASHNVKDDDFRFMFYNLNDQGRPIELINNLQFEDQVVDLTTVYDENFAPVDLTKF